jgi:chemotaxis protein MotB
MASRRRRRGAHEQENEERWLLTYSDMITLLMALFMVLFSISSVNVSKYKSLQKALREAFSGQVFPGGKSLEQTGSSSSTRATPESAATTSVMPFAVESPQQAASQLFKSTLNAGAVSPQQELESLQRVEQQVKAYIAAHGLGSYATVTLEPRGLVITLLTDKLLFPTGEATLEPRSFALLEEIATLIALEARQPVAVQGNTDSVPIDTTQYPSNWELSTARASTIIRFLIAHGISAQRLTAIGYAAERPIASNASEAGRARNRRVEIVLERLSHATAEGEAGAEGTSTGGAGAGGEATAGTPAATASPTAPQSAQAGSEAPTPAAGQSGAGTTSGAGALVPPVPQGAGR